MRIIGGFVPKKVSVSTCVEKSFIALFTLFTDRERYGAVRKTATDFGYNIADYFVCIMQIFAALQNIGAKAQPVSFFAAGEDFVLCQSVTDSVLVVPPDTAVVAVVAAIVRKFYQSTDIHFIAVYTFANFVGLLKKQFIKEICLKQSLKFISRKISFIF